ncbi:MAG: IS200/IS605 family accessory protein TnpB-related protein [Desulfurococcaceae archaeon]|nr:IS200/IS605 family accessory protein TnpB-related protein [Desulfurococcaceae archaeon]
MNLLMRVLATARVEAVAPEGGEALLTQFLKLYRDAVQYIVDGIWFLDDVPSEEKLHKMFYSELRRLCFRAHHVSEIYKRAREVVEATKKNRGSKPILKKLTARIHPLDYKIDFNAKVLRVAVLNDEWVELKLKWYKHLDTYLDGSWKPGEILISYRNNKIFVYITFHKDVELTTPRAVMGIDINFSNITYTVIDLNGSLVSIGVIPFKGLERALHLKKLAEDLQKRYPNSWRFMKWVGRVRGRWLSKARNILMDSAHKLSKRLAEIAKEYSALIVFEDLDKLKENSNNNHKLSWEKSLWCYKRIQMFTEYKAMVYGIKTVYVNPAKTSRKSPNGKKLRFINYRYVELGGVVTSRDVIASWNIALRGLKKLKRMRGSRVVLSPDSPADEGMRTRPNAGNPEARKMYLQLTTAIRR